MGIDLQDIWARAKNGGSVSQEEIATVEAALRGSVPGERELPMLIIGVTRKPESSLITLMHNILMSSSVDAERYSALKVLCRYWRLWDDYLEYMMDKISPQEFDSDPAVSEEAFNLLGEYLWGNPDREVWCHLIGVYDTSIATAKEDLAKEAYWSIYVGVFGPKETLRRRLRREYCEHDPQVLLEARAKAGLTN